MTLKNIFWILTDFYGDIDIVSNSNTVLNEFNLFTKWLAKNKTSLSEDYSVANFKKNLEKRNVYRRKEKIGQEFEQLDLNWADLKNKKTH